MMPFIYTTGQYLLWHYTLAKGRFIFIAGDLLWFLSNYFSLPELIRTWARPWKKMGQFSRLIGIVLRTVIIVSASLILLIAMAIIITAALVWLLIPVIIAFTFITGLVLLVF